MSLYEHSDKIAGGIEVISDTIKCGGQERVVGENTKWYMRNKFLQFKHLSKSKTADEKALLKIVNLKIPLTFGKKLNFYDDDKNSMPVKSEKKNNEDIYDKAIDVLNTRLNESIDVITNRLIVEYNLRSPLFWVLGDTVKFLAVVYKKKKPSGRKIKISPQMAELVEKIWKNNNYFQYVINSDDIPNNMMELMLYMLEAIEKNKPSPGNWKEPTLEIVKYPCWCSTSKKKIGDLIDEEKKKLKHKIGDKRGIEVIREYIFTILTIENILIDRVDKLEHYFIHLAKNIRKLFISLRNFFKKT
jgi:hypothetical protein